MNDELILRSRLDVKGKEFTKNKKASNKIKIKVVCNHSVNQKDLFFTNYLEHKRLDTISNTQVYNITNSDGKELSKEKIPFDLTKNNDYDNEQFLKCNKDKDRIPAILKLYNEVFEENTILKCYGKSRIGHGVAGESIPKDVVRVFVKREINEDVWKVLLIDPNHLVATELYKKEYEKYKNFQMNINQLEI